VVYHDTKNRIIWVNQAAGDSIGVDPERLIGQRCYEAWHKRKKPCAGCPVIKALKTKQTQTAEINTPDGRVWWIKGYPVIDDKGKVEGLIEITQEITEQKQSGKQLKETTTMLESILNAIPDVLGVQDPHHGIIRYNEAGYQFLQMSYEDVHGKRCYELIGRTAPCDICATSECYKTKKPARVEKYVEELQAWLDCRAYPILDDSGNIKLIIEHLRDITERKKVDKDLKKRERELKEHVKELEEFYYMAVGRELRMKQLKEENEELKEELKKYKKQ
jgi:PAS domain S-box-containing protein